MFIANLTGSLQKITGRDVHGRHELSPSMPCPFSPVSLANASTKTTVRADSSASRGSSDERVTERGKVLIPTFISVSNNDIFTFQGIKYEIVMVHQRYSTGGRLDHFECDLETFLS